MRFRWAAAARRIIIGFTDDRKYIWAGRLDDNKIFIFDVGTDPAKPKLVNTIVDFDKKTGYVGPHTFYALPGRMLVGALSNTKDHGGVTGLAIYSNAGEFLSAHPMPIDNGGDGYGYDIGINPAKNALADLQLYRLEQLHDGFRQARSRSRTR